MLTLRQRYLTEWLKCYNTADTAVSGVVDQKSRRGRKFNFLTDSCKFQTGEIMVAQNFNSVPKSPPQIGDINSKFSLLGEKCFIQKENFPTEKIYGGGTIGPCPSCHDTTDNDPSLTLISTNTNADIQ